MRFLREFFGRTREVSTSPIAPPDHAIEETFRLLAENSADVIFRIGPDKIARYVSPSVQRLLGWLPEEIVGFGPDKFVYPPDLSIVASAHTRQHKGEVDSASYTYRIIRKDGDLVWVEGNARPIRDPSSGEITDIVMVMRDVTDRKRLEDRLSEMARTDGLTGIANRRAFDEAFAREWRQTLRAGSQMSLLIFDLDYFKAFNDRYGHHVGDDCLRAAAAAAQAAANRATDLVARYGGEEFAVILPDTNAAGAALTAERIRSAIEALQIPHAANVQGGGWVTVSIGAATALSRHGGTTKMPEGLLISADAALYKAKADGRNCVATSLLLTPDESTRLAS